MTKSFTCAARHRRRKLIITINKPSIVLLTFITGTALILTSSFNQKMNNLVQISSSFLPLKNQSNISLSWHGSVTFPVITGVSAMPFKINKNTVEMLNKGLTTLIGIKRLLTTIRSVNELSLQAFPSLASKPRIGYIMKLINGGKLPLSQGSGFSSSQSAKRNPSMGLIKIGEKPPPGLFSEMMPFTMNGNFGESGTSVSSNSPAVSSSSNKSVTLNPIELFAHFGAAAVAASSSENSNKISTFGKKNKRPVIITKHNIHEFQQANSLPSSSKPFFEGTYEVLQNPHF